MLWCLKSIHISLTLIWTLLWGPGGPKVPKMKKRGHSIEVQMSPNEGQTYMNGLKAP